MHPLRTIIRFVDGMKDIPLPFISDGFEPQNGPIFMPFTKQSFISFSVHVTLYYIDTNKCKDTNIKKLSGVNKSFKFRWGCNYLNETVRR